MRARRRQFQTVIQHEKAIEPIGESKSDFEAVVEIAKKLGMEEEVTAGYTIPEYVEGVYKNEVRQDRQLGEFSEKDYMVIPVSKSWKDVPAGLYEFYKDPEANPLPTPSGKLEFYSESLDKAFPCDEERPPYPQWIEKA